jgi:hypothetical protein
MKKLKAYDDNLRAKLKAVSHDQANQTRELRAEIEALKSDRGPE